MSTDAAVAKLLNETLPGETPLVESLLAMQVDTQRRSGLDDRTFLLVRIAALAALDASRDSYLVNFILAADAGVSPDEVRGVLIALGPLIGSARVLSAAGKALDVVRGG